LVKRSYEKEENMLLKKNFICKKLYGDIFDKTIYGKTRTIKKPLIPLSKLGKEIIGNFIDENKRLENLKLKKEEEEYKKIHSKKIVIKNVDKPLWRHCIKFPSQFNKIKIDTVYAFNKEKKDKKLIEPWRNNKIKGTYFDHDIHPLQ
jgi:hypothetical protein